MATPHARRRVIARVLCAFILLCIISAANGAEGTGNVYLEDPISDPNGYWSVTLFDLDGSGFLRGDAADVTNPFPFVGRAFSSGLDFSYVPDASFNDKIHFAETMGYYHTTEYRDYLADMGFSGLGGPVAIDVFNAELFGVQWKPIASGYDPHTGRVSLGASADLNDSDAMDADVIIHEYAHAIQHKLLGGVPGVFTSLETTASEQALALMEGLADYAAVSRFDRPVFAEYAASLHNLGAFVRNADNFRRWSDDVVEGTYPTGMIFTGAMWDLRTVVGPEAADSLAWKTMQTIADNDLGTSELNTTFADVLSTMVQADVDLYGGAHADDIRQAFAVHGVGDYDFSTSFPMVRDPGNDYDGLEEYAMTGAAALAITFDEFVTKLDDSGFTTDRSPHQGMDEKSTVDLLTILDAADTVIGTFTGRELQGATVIVPGETLKLHLVTDSYLAPFGYRVVAVSSLAPGDADGDGLVGDDDLSALLANWGLDTDWPGGEFIGDHIVDDNDLSLLLANWNGQAGPPESGAAPEPGTVVLLVTGGCISLVRRRT